MTELTHVNDRGEAHMVNVGAKDDTVRIAVASGGVRMQPATLEKIKSNQVKKGDVLAAARLAGIMAAKKTPDLIPLCHTIMLNAVSVDFEFVSDDFIKITASAESTGKTGVEMEALVAVSVSALTIYDMCKAVDRGMTIQDVRLEKKSGGKSGIYERGEPMTKIVGVCISDKKGEKKHDIGTGILRDDFGLEGDAHSCAGGHRQLSMLGTSSIDKMVKLGADVGSGSFAENLTVQDDEFKLYNLAIGTRMRIGKDILVEVTQVGKECHDRCAIFKQVGTCVMPVEGIFVRILKGGAVKTGDTVTLIS